MKSLFPAGEWRCFERHQRIDLYNVLQGWCATLGPPTGLRQVSISRYSFGWWPSKIIAFLNVVEQLGWCSVGCITGGYALSAVAGNNLTPAVGIIIVSVCGVTVSFFGLRAVLKYEEFAWAVFFVIFMHVPSTAVRFGLHTNSDIPGLCTQKQDHMRTLTLHQNSRAQHWAGLASLFLQSCTVPAPLGVPSSQITTCNTQSTQARLKSSG